MKQTYLPKKLEPLMGKHLITTHNKYETSYTTTVIDGIFWSGVVMNAEIKTSSMFLPLC